MLVACSDPASGPTPETTPGVSSPAATSTQAAIPAPETAIVDSVTGLRAPWGVAFLDDGRALITQRDTATVRLLTKGRLTVAGSIDDVVPEGEGGLLGIAVQGDRSVFVYYTSATDNRIARLDWDGRRLSNQRTVFSGIPKGPIHDGGRIGFGPDGMLYVTTGDTGDSALAQDLNSLGGKILRITALGAPAAGNPFAGSAVWSYGHRNVQGIAWDARGRLWASEFGEQDIDELNLIQAGGNYGWPVCEGPCDVSGMTNPKATWSPTSTASPSGIAALAGSVWVASLRGETLYEVPLRGAAAARPIPWLSGEYGRLRDVVATDGRLWVLTNNTDGRGVPQLGDDRLLSVPVPPPR